MPDGVIHELHAHGLSADDDVRDFLRGAFTDDGRHGGRGKEDFIDGYASRLVAALHQELRHDAAEGARKHGAYLGLLVGREYVNDTVNGFAGVVRVQGAEYQKAGFSRRECQGDGFQVAHFTHQHDVGVFTEGSPQAVCEGGCLEGHFPLGDDGFFIGVNEFDRFLHRDDVPRLVAVDVVNDGGQGGGFTGARGPRDQP